LEIFPSIDMLIFTVIWRVIIIWKRVTRKFSTARETLKSRLSS
jgi:hypothetical protein